MIKFNFLAKASLIGMTGFVAACNEVAAPTAPDEGTECRSAEFQKLLWRPASALDGVSLKNTRVIHPDTAVTMDYRPTRTNVVIGKSGRIEKVYCG